ncbi:MAG: type IX secretion system membrane protein PorP/SprF, partial [Bacteroidetes bacterium]|nr:type IX secretion system membrane protein PorP/SprF [Bacteroidota bacterium]
DISVGLLYLITTGTRSNIYGGLAIPHLGRPVESFNDDPNKLYRKLVIHGGSQYFLRKDLSILPSIVYFKKGPEFEITGGTYIQYDLNNEDVKTAILFGSWYRLNDAVIFASRIKYGALDIGFSYDVNLSTLNTASNYKGGPEISLIYIGIIGNRGSAMIMPCPVF